MYRKKVSFSFIIACLLHHQSSLQLTNTSHRPRRRPSPGRSAMLLSSCPLSPQGSPLPVASSVVDSMPRCRTTITSPICVGEQVPEGQSHWTKLLQYRQPQLAPLAKVSSGQFPRWCVAEALPVVARCSHDSQPRLR